MRTPTPVLLSLQCFCISLAYKCFTHLLSSSSLEFFFGWYFFDKFLWKQVRELSWYQPHNTPPKHVPLLYPTQQSALCVPFPLFLGHKSLPHECRSPTRRYASPQQRRPCLDSGYVSLLWDSCSPKLELLWLARPFSVPCFGSCRVAWLSCHMCFTKTMLHARQPTVWTLRLMAPLSAERNNTHVLDLGARCVLMLSGSSD